MTDHARGGLKMSVIGCYGVMNLWFKSLSIFKEEFRTEVRQGVSTAICKA